MSEQKNNKNTPEQGFEGSIGARALKLARQKKITQDKLAEGIGLKQSTVSLWGRDGRNPPAKRLPDLAKLLGVSLEYLLTGEEDKEPTAEKSPRRAKGDKGRYDTETASSVKSILENLETIINRCGGLTGENAATVKNALDNSATAIMALFNEKNRRIEDLEDMAEHLNVTIEDKAEIISCLKNAAHKN
jgi:transcriptional regulator with XRE-family HTH domain